MTFTVKTKIWKYPGFGGWHFATVDKSTTKKIKRITDGGPRRGWGSVKVTAQLKDAKWDTSIFPTKEGEYLLAVKSEVRKQTGIKMGDTVSIKLTLKDF